MTTRPRVLLVEDEPGLVLTLRDGLEGDGYAVSVATDGPSGAHRATVEPWDIILLDVMLPGASGFDVCRDLRARGIATPIIMLTARGQLVDKVLGLKLGADDYLTKPFEMLELSARIAVQLRRQPVPALTRATEYHFGDFIVDFRRAEIARDDEPVDLSAREFMLLKYLIDHRGATISRDELLNAVWGYDATPATRTVDVHVAWLRQKIEPNPKRPQYLLTVHGLGYKFVG